jgi:molybdopterin molybdotransferase
VLSTGTELRRPGEPLGAGEIYESNSPMLTAAFEASGAVVERLDPVVDDSDAHRRALKRGLEADVLVSSGGVSVGPHDLVRRVLADLGVEEVFWGVAVKPGKPLAFGVRGHTLVFGLPGNPVSSLVSVELFVRPALAALQGSEPGPRYERALLGSPLRPNRARDELVRARASFEGDETVVEPLSGQESHMIVRAAAAEALVHVPAGEGELPAGTVVRILRLS